MWSKNYFAIILTPVIITVNIHKIIGHSGYTKIFNLKIRRDIMPGIGIMTDSNCGIMPSEERGDGIHVLPMPVIIDGKTFSEGVDITPDIFYQKQASGSVITTSQPSPGDVAAMWDRLLSSYDEIVFIPMSSGLSNTCQTALILADDEPYRGRVHVVDNHRISVTQAVSVLDAKSWQTRAGPELK